MKVFCMNEFHWWAAPDLETAIKDYARFIGTEEEEILEDDEPYELSEEQLDSTYYWTGESRDLLDFENWEDEHGNKADFNCRWNGQAYSRHAGYPLGHVQMKCVGRITFRERLSEIINNNYGSDIFATTEE